MPLSCLRLHHGLRGGCAALEPEAVTVATPLFRCPVWHRGGLGCACHPTLPGRSLRFQQSLQEGHWTPGTAESRGPEASAAANAIEGAASCWPVRKT